VDDAAPALPPYGDATSTTIPREAPVNTRRCQIQSLQIGEDGSVDLPDGAVIVSLEFDSAGPYGYQARPVRAWVEVPAEAAE
jgi:hypothetical protein